VRVRGLDGSRSVNSSDTPIMINGSLVPQLIDELPLLAVVGTQLDGGLEIRDAAELRLKESDRIATTVQNLRAMGAVVEEFDDGLRVTGPARLRGARIDPRGDHRIVMAFAVAALLAEGETEIENAGCVAVSFPEFFELLASVVERWTYVCATCYWERGRPRPHWARSANHIRPDRDWDTYAPSGAYAGEGARVPSMNNRRIVIVGFMGSGKTTVAGALARELGCPMTDLDSFIAEREGRSPAEIIQRSGEPAFRQIETEALRELLERKDTRVIALGGGTWAIKVNRALVAERDCLSVWLDAPFELCWERIVSAETVRPLAPDRATARMLYDDRRATYQLSDRQLKVEREDSPTIVADTILNW